MRIDISAAYDDDGQIVAYCEGHTFGAGEDWPRIYSFKHYDIEFRGSNDDETYLCAIDAAAAIEFAHALWHGPYTIAERLVTWREVAEVDN